MGMNPRLLRPRASGFNPKSISGLAVWLDGSDAATLTLNGSAVSQWADKSGNGRNATQATALNQPTTSTINGKGAVSFDGNSDGLLLGDLSAAFPTAATGFWVHTKHSGANTGSYMVASTRNNDGWWTFGGGSSYLGVFRSTRLGPTAIDLEPAALNCVAVLSTSATYEVYVQGSKVHTAAASYAGGDNHVIGAGKVPLDFYLLASVGEVLYYNRALSASEMTTIHKYLSGKWGFTLS